MGPRIRKRVDARRNDPSARSPHDIPQGLTLRGSEALPHVFVTTKLRQPNIYRKRIRRMEGTPRGGDWVSVFVEDGTFLGYGIYNPRSEIAVRVIRFGASPPDDAFWSDLLDTAVSLRHDTLRLERDTDMYRVVHAEADGLPGLVIDRFGPVLSAEAFSLGMFQRAPEILKRLAGACDTPHWRLVPAPHFEAQEGPAPDSIASPACPRTVETHEFGTRFRIRFDGAHKTGFFCDQRENRRTLAEFSDGKSVLDICCYTGGFALQAKRLGNAREVTGVDLDEVPLALARENAALNQVRIRFVQADAFAYLRDMIRNGQQYDIVVLDPPKLIRSRAEIEEGTRKHLDLNRLAMQLVARGGLLLTCTCAGLLPTDEFLRVIRVAGQQAFSSDAEESPSTAAARGRSLQIVRKTGAAADHPITPQCPETEYLRAFWIRVT